MSQSAVASRFPDLNPMAHIWDVIGREDRIDKLQFYICYYDELV